MNRLIGRLPRIGIRAGFIELVEILRCIDEGNCYRRKIELIKNYLK